MSNMKLIHLLAIPCLALFVSCAGAPKQHLAPPSFRPVTQSVEKLAENNKKSQTHAEKAKKAIDEAEKAESPQILKLALKDARNEIDALTQILLDDAAEIQRLETEIVPTLKKEVEVQTEKANLAIDQNEKLTKENDGLKAQVKVEKAHVHKLKIGICTLGAAIGAFIVFQFGSGLIALFGPWGLLAYVAVPGAIFGFLWRYL